MRTFLIIFILAAFVDTLSQFRIMPVDFPKERKMYQSSILPKWLFEWNFPRVPIVGSVFNAVKQFQGWGIFLLGLSFGIHEIPLWLANIYHFLMDNELDLNSRLVWFILQTAYFAVLMMVWYQIRNVFLKVFIKRRKQS